MSTDLTIVLILTAFVVVGAVVGLWWVDRNKQ